MKGVVSLPMPKRWYNEKAAAKSDNPIDVNICASKKPYFMIYRYPELYGQYRAFQNAVDMKCLLLFGVPFSEIDGAPESADRDRILEQYDKYCPTQQSDGVVNRICAMCENYFASRATERKSAPKFDASILKSGVTYTTYTKGKIMRLCDDYMARLRQVCVERLDDEQFATQKLILVEEFREACAVVCPEMDELCDIVVDICYRNEKSKQFAWDMCGVHMVNNVLRRNGGKISYPRRAKQGDIVYGGRRFKLETLEVKELDEGYYTE